MRYALGNVEEEVLSDPDLQIPPARLRETLEPGDLAELMLLSDQMTGPAWVEVVDVLGPGHYSGIFESGEPVEFGAEHVADVAPREAPSFMMGAPPNPEPFEILRRPRSARAPEPFEILRRPPPPRPPSPFEVLRRGPPPAPAPGTTPKPSPAAPRRSFLDLFRRKPKVEVEPIPEAERRRPAAAPHELPGLPSPEPVPAPAAVPTPAPAPPVDIVSMGPGNPPPASPSVPPAGGMIIAPETLPAEAFDILSTRAPAAPSGGLILPESRLPAAAELDIFSILAPEEEPPAPSGIILPPAAGLPTAPDPFSILTPSTGLAPAGPVSPFEILAPAPPSAFDILVPETGLAPFEERGGEFAPYDPQSLDLFTMIAPEGAPAPPPRGPQGPTPPEEIERPEAPKRKGKQRKVEKPPPPEWVKKGKKWILPTPESIIPWIESVFNMKTFWEIIRRDRTSEEFREMVLREADGDEPALLPLETITYTYANEWPEEVATFFEIPRNVIQPWLDEIAKEEQRGDNSSETYWDLEAYLVDYYTQVTRAFDLIKPRDIPGRIVVEPIEDQIVLGYWEALPEEERRRIEREQQFLEEQEEEKKNARKKALRKIWGRMPTAEELVPFIEDKFDIDALFREIRKERKKKDFKEVLEDQGEARVFLEKVTAEGPHYWNEVGFYFSLPPELLAVYLDREKPLQQEFWDEVLNEFFSRISDAFDEIKPRDLPGMIVVDGSEDDEDLYLQYFEQAT